MPAQCQNCSAPIQGDYCYRCGQSSADFDLPAAEFAKEFASEAFSLDSRLRLTMKPLFLKPGAVPQEYVAGHRARFVPPIRLYIFATFTMFLMLTLGGGLNVGTSTLDDAASSPGDSVSVSDERAIDAEPLEPAEGGFGDRLADRVVEGLRGIQEDPEPFSDELQDRLPTAVFLLLPVFALLLKLVHRRRLYVHHIVFSVYHHSFVFFVVAFVALPQAMRLPEAFDSLGFAVLSIPVYLFLGMRRFYEESWLKTFAKFVFVSVTYGIVGVTMLLATFFVVLLTI